MLRVKTNSSNPGLANCQREHFPVLHPEYFALKQYKTLAILSSHQQFPDVFQPHFVFPQYLNPDHTVEEVEVLNLLLFQVLDSSNHQSPMHDHGRVRSEIETLPRDVVLRRAAAGKPEDEDERKRTGQEATDDPPGHQRGLCVCRFVSVIRLRVHPPRPSPFIMIWSVVTQGSLPRGTYRYS